MESTFSGNFFRHAWVFPGLPFAAIGVFGWQQFQNS